MTMKWRTPPPEHKPVTVTRPDGSTFETSTETTFAPVPVPPKDWDLISTRIAVGMVLALTLVAVAWSTWSIGALLHGGIGYLAAIVFDLSWGTALILEWKSRYDADKRTFPEVLGWILLAVTMGAIFWHALPDLRYAVVGAVVSGVAKILWLGIMKHIGVKLKKQDADDLADRRSKAAVGLAFASVDRQVMRTNAHTAAVRLALEQSPETLRLVADGTDETELVRAGRQLIDQAHRDGTDPEPVAIPAASRDAADDAATRLSRKVDLLSKTIEQMAEQITITVDRDREHDREQIASTPDHDREHAAITASTIASTDQASDHSAVTRAITDRDQPSISDLARQMIAITASNPEAVAKVLASMPDANPQSVGAAVRRERRKAGPYL
ncbi:hypothetical protein [Streptomyces prunicolor]|uniref:hypothetical protein n=1 Tax=Streptomyces prunicolor TaxID=67348 RepID=UPI0033FAD45D